MKNVADILTQIEFSKVDLEALLSIEDEADLEALRRRADTIQREIFHDTVHFRGLIEFSNICVKNCLYCGIRRDASHDDRYQLTEQEIVDVAKWNQDNGYGSITLQAGERYDEKFIAFVESVTRKCKEATGNRIGITLCCGEQTEETYRRWFAAGAHRYLLRIETSNPVLYAQIHPQDSLHSFENRVRCLRDLRALGYQVGTGVMIGLPGQTVADLAADILFFKEMGAHMIGMGPYIVQSETPLGKSALNTPQEIRRRFNLSLKMIAVTRIFSPRLNIAATTALQALDPKGREKGVAMGANILMPIATPTRYRASYQLYDDKPCVEDTTEQCKSCLAARMRFAGRAIGYADWGDSPLFINEHEATRSDAIL